jgi:hypothetical protein
MAKSVTGRTTDELDIPKAFAKPYAEEYEELDQSEFKAVNVQHTAIDIEYHTRRGTKTVRSHGLNLPSDWNDIPEGFGSFYHDGRKYAYSPEQRKLMTVPRDGPNRTVAEGNDIYKVRAVTFGERAPVKGAIGTDREATIYYRSNRSDKMQTVTVWVKRLEGNRSASKITGTDENGRRIEALTRWERDISTYHTTLGKVARVEFPRGQRFTVEVEGISQKQARDRFDRLEKYASKAFSDVDSVDVVGVESMEWDSL